MLHYILQGAGRGGRKSKNCKRERVLVYILFNNSDIGDNVPGNIYMITRFECMVIFFVSRNVSGGCEFPAQWTMPQK